MGKIATLCVAVLACLTVLAMPVLAGPLANNPDAFNDGHGPCEATGLEGAWTLSTPFDNGAGGVAGTVEWAVFEPDVMSFDTGAWEPTEDEMCYVLQIHSTGTAAISSYSVPVVNYADNIGCFEDSASGLTGTTPHTMELTYGTGGEAYWTFSGPALNSGDSSCALAFCSPNIPQPTFSIVVDSGTIAVAIPVPTPSAVPIPEPGTITLLLTSLAFIGMATRRRRA